MGALDEGAARGVAVVTLRLDIVPQNGYPFEVRVEITYALHAEHGLR